MKKSVILVVVLIVIALIAIWFKNTGPNIPVEETVPTESVSVSETTKVSNTLSEYHNAELGFAVNYPSTWEREDSNSGVNFIIPLDTTQVSSISTLQGNIQVISGTCAFPPVTTVKERGTFKVGNLSLNMISMSNTVQGRVYSNHMYSLQKDDICYMFSFASKSDSTASKGLTGSKATQATNNNKAIVAAADKAFADVVKSFTFVVGPQGEDETQGAPANKY